MQPRCATQHPAIIAKSVGILSPARYSPGSVTYGRADWRDWLYWPSRPEYVVPWTLGPALFMVLGALGFSTAVTQHISRSAPSPGMSILILLIATLLNFVLLLTHVRSAHLSWKCGIRPTAGTLVLLTTAYVSLAGLWLTLHGQIQSALFAGFEWGTTLHVAATGAQILTAILMISAFWKIDEPRIADLLRARDVALPVLTTKRQVTRSEYATLLEALATLKSEGLAGRLTSRQREILAKWKTAAGALYEKLEERGTTEVSELLRAEEVKKHVAALERTC